MPYAVRRRGDKFCVVKSKTGDVVKCHTDRADAVKHLRALYSNVHDAEIAASAVVELQGKGPLLTNVPNVQIVKTGIEYPLSTGPRTFTPEDLLDAVKAQDDPAIPAPRIWLGHPDDTRLHGDRSSGHLSGEPAIGRVQNMALVQEGHTIVGDLSGVPLWFARIMSSAFPSRSIEGRSNWQTPTGNKWKFVINELALLGVVWPGVNTIEDIASLYTEAGPEYALIEATEEQPVTVIPALERKLAAGVGLTYEDLRRQFYTHVRGQLKLPRHWIRALYAEPQEIMVDDEQGGIHRMRYGVENGKINFGPLEQVKVQYVNASDGGIRPVTNINEGKPYIVMFDTKADSEPEWDSIVINLGAK